MSTWRAYCRITNLHLSCLDKDNRLSELNIIRKFSKQYTKEGLARVLFRLLSLETESSIKNVLLFIGSRAHLVALISLFNAVTFQNIWCSACCCNSEQYLVRCTLFCHLFVRTILITRPNVVYTIH